MWTAVITKAELKQRIAAVEKTNPDQFVSCSDSRDVISGIVDYILDKTDETLLNNWADKMVKPMSLSIML